MPVHASIHRRLLMDWALWIHMRGRESVCERERERETARQRNIDRQIDRWIDR